MDELRQVLSIVLELASQQIDQLDDETMRTLTQLINLAAERLSEEQVNIDTPQVPELDAAPHPSSNINAFRYDPQSKKLFVKFQDKYPNTNGPVYQYEGVPQFIFDVFSRGAVAPKTSGKNAWHRWRKGKTPSLGAAMYALVKQGGYPYQKVA